MKNISLKVKIAGVLIIVLATSIVYIVYSAKKGGNTIPQTPATIASTGPTNDSLGASVFDPIIITFNQPVDAATINVTSDPAESWTIAQRGQNSIAVNHKLYLLVATSYVLTILQHGNSVGTLTFETAHEQNDPRQLQSLQSELGKNYPLVSLTPYETADYRVVYSATLTLEIDLKSSITEQDAISQVKLWVNSHGVDPTTHTYNIVLPSPTPTAP